MRSVDYFVLWPVSLTFCNSLCAVCIIFIDLTIKFRKVNCQKNLYLWQQVDVYICLCDRSRFLFAYHIQKCTQKSGQSNPEGEGETRKEDREKKELDLRHSCQVVMKIMFRNMANKVNPSCGGIHFIIPWLSLLYISNFHCFLHMFLGRIRNALCLLRAGWGECRCKRAICGGWFWQYSPAVTLGHGDESHDRSPLFLTMHLGMNFCTLCSK